ncbi:hypothetical protein CFOL_v3_32940 [Cephalotus follicularis]|uniref:Uncharacterized protein n=1 Tax=Cephalotus follicularis TaxID=3775 RepID=A0A1Q3DAH6_CEPFO|nr:hypothetical protein CFOL_v3_32940 [Cephalotus follicularis]
MGNWHCFNSMNHLKDHISAPGNSDHSPAIIQFHNLDSPLGRNFKYLNIWASHPSFLNVVKEAWLVELPGRQGIPLERIGHKLKLVKQGLKELHRKFFNDIASPSVLKREALEDVQARLNLDPMSLELRGREREAILAVKEADRLEEEVSRQRSRVQWLKLGDSNTAYFHIVVKMRQSRNTISSVQSGSPQIGEECVKFFSGFLNGSSKRGGGGWGG